MLHKVNSPSYEPGAAGVQLARLEDFYSRNNVEWNANLRSDIATSLEEFMADPETDSKTFGMVTRHTVYEVGIGDEEMTFRC
jgi:hypothetical protein